MGYVPKQSKYPNFCVGDTCYPTDSQERAMNTIVHYLPHLQELREQCDTKEKASEFIGKYMDESYAARSKKLNGC